MPGAPLAPGTAPSSGYTTPYYAHLPRSSSTGSVSSLNLNVPAFPGPLSMGPYDAPSPMGFDKLSLSSAHSAAGSRFTTPKSVLLGLPPEGEPGGGGGGMRSEKRRSASDESDAAVVAATALAGMAGSAGAGTSPGAGGAAGLSLKRVKQEEREVRMDVDG